MLRWPAWLPAPRLGVWDSTEEMADFIVRLLEPGHDYLTGVDLILDGGKFGMTTAKQLA